MPNTEKYLLILDKDKVLIHSSQCDIHTGNVVYNGANEINDATPWLTFINTAIEQGKKQGIQVIPMILTSQRGGNVDFTIKHIAEALAPVLVPRDANAEPLCDSEGNLYAPYMLHVENTITPYHPDQANLPAFSNDYIPPIHICYNNKKDGREKLTSKAPVINHICKFFKIPSHNVLLIDDDWMNIREANELGCNTLHAVHLTKPHNKKDRIDLCNQLFEHALQLMDESFKKSEAPEEFDNLAASFDIHREIAQLKKESDPSPTSNRYAIDNQNARAESTLLNRFYRFFRPCNCIGQAQNAVIPTI